MSSLGRAVRDGRLEEARRLLCQGENIDAKEDGKTPLHVAAEMGRLDVARMLVVDGHANVHANDEYRRTPLHWAAEKGHVAVARMLVVKGRAESSSSCLLSEGLIRLLRVLPSRPIRRSCPNVRGREASVSV